MQPKRSLPIDDVLPQLSRVLRDGRAAVVQAPPGAGKTTRVPLALLEEPWLNGKIVMLEPRRLAARAAARYMARQLGEEVGGTVGYRVRLDTRVGPRTRIEVVTEGVLTRMLHGDPSLEGVAVVIFDEFHERSLHADLGLALTLQTQSLLRPDLRLVVMSATLDGERVAGLLDHAPVVTSAGRLFPVDTHYAARPLEGRVEDAVIATVRRALEDEGGDTLVFLPGAAEIERVRTALADSLPDHTTDVYPLYGQLPADVQDRAIAPSPAGRRKIVLATSIAETSLTIDGVRVVVDAGLMRVPRFSPRTGMTRLETLRVTRASADQRRGRAGRTQAGVCYRLWTEAEQAALLAHGQPEIMQADLAPLALDLARWGVRDPLELKWLDAPPAAAYSQARELLHELGALDGNGVITAHGRDLADLPIHPRLAHMLVRARGLDLLGTAADLAALLDERDLLRDTRDPDLRLRLHALRQKRGDRALLQRLQAEARALRELIGGAAQYDDEAAGLLLAFAYPDRIGRRRDARGRYLLRNGRGAVIETSSALAAAEFVVIAQVDDRGAESRAFLAVPIERAHIEEHFADQFEVSRAVEWDGKGRGIERVQLGSIVLTERQFTADRHELAEAFVRALQRDGLDSLRWSDAARQLRERLAFLHTADASWPAADDAALLQALSEVDPTRLDLYQLLMDQLSWQQRAKLDEVAPTHVTVPSGSRLPIDYSNPTSPVLAARLQELFGWKETPRIAGGRVPLTLHLLSPAHRPVQVTRDLASFWRSGYFDVKKDLKGRYPKHYWPDDPLSATATRRVRPKPTEDK